VLRHVEDEEQKLFEAARELLDAETARELGTTMARQREAWLELERRNPGAAGMVRGLTQVVERLPFGGAIAAAVQRNPRMLVRVASAARLLRPDTIPRFIVRTVTRPLRAPLSLVMSR
jgi:hypothetical protein